VRQRGSSEDPMEDSVIAKMTLSTRFSLGFSKRFVMTERGGSVLARLSV
jgi:hypothetical protein